MRLREARVLLKAGHHSGAYYLAGYAVECALKACIARQTQRHDFPDKKTADKAWTHNFPKLVSAAGLATLIDKACERSRPFQVNWSIVIDWNEACRYEQRRAGEARDLYRAITRRDHGVLRWIRQYW